MKWSANASGTENHIHKHTGSGKQWVHPTVESEREREREDIHFVVDVEEEREREG